MNSGEANILSVYELFYERLSKTHPEIKLITSAGWTDCGKDLIWLWIG